MSIAKIIKNKIKKLDEGSIITYDDFSKLNNFQAVALTLSRLAKAGEITRLQKGKYYIPRKTKFGILPPSESSILKNILSSSNGYISGTSAYNRLGLTTQTANEILIVSDKYSSKTQIGNLKIKFVKSNVDNAKENQNLLIILDAIRDFKKIQDGVIEEIIGIIKKRIYELNQKEIYELIKLSINYRPYVIAILGEILEEKKIKGSQKLKDRINPLTKFKLNISKEVMPHKSNWNIV